ncbi:acyl carrier protein phosphodiesterase [Dyadobacter sandarakinus]|uniref:DUF479 domain-containing protein n=1 Tax=Dyadobacter sandarakinus TaxID=2747268 RepID=A0ABX7I4K0_9BACT|nr:acyl carrier protein phosphodiesterase [Dyadobacter sandarakinus]QRR00432.1 DUF479 domain-containing protein [Dyadobacter sandarakinus]
MNFLAHILLSGEKPGVIMGNYVGDFVKGRLTEEKTALWNPDFVLGLKLHRFIDFYTDKHEIVQEAVDVASLALGRLAGIAVDIYFDYFLARYFARFREESLAAYTHGKYALIEENEHLVPPGMVPMVRSMIRQDWLTGYATLEGIDLTFSRLSRRAEFLAPVAGAMHELRAHEEYYCEKFFAFFPDLQNASAEFRLQGQNQALHG